MSGYVLPQVEVPNDDLYLTLDEGSWFASLVMVGCILGGLMSGVEMSLLGRKKTMILENLIAAVSFVVMGFAKDVWTLYACRIVLGYAFGSLCACTPIYIGEISQPQVRGLTNTATSVLYCLGAGLSYGIGALFYWRTALLVSAAGPLLTSLSACFLMESPVWLILKGKKDEARQSLARLRRNKDVEAAEFSRIVQCISEYNRTGEDADEEEEDLTYFQALKELFSQSTFWFPFASVTIILSLGMEMSGFSVLAFYMVSMLKESRIPIDPYTLAVAISFYRMILCMVATSWISKFDRKPFSVFVVMLSAVGSGLISLLYFGQDAMGLLDKFEFLKWGFLVGYIIMYGASGGGMCQIIYAYQGELLPSYGRSIGSGLAGVLDYICLITMLKVAPKIDKYFGPGVLFAVFCVSSILLGLFILFFVPETRNKTLEEIEEHYRSVCGVKDEEDADYDKMSVLDTVSLYSSRRVGGFDAMSMVSRRTTRSSVSEVMSMNITIR